MSKSLHINKINEKDSVKIFPSRFLELPHVDSAPSDSAKSEKGIVTHKQKADKFWENKLKSKGIFFNETLKFPIHCKKILNVINMHYLEA